MAELTRVSVVLELAWEDLDHDAGTAQIRRRASYTSSVGMVLGSTKTSGAEGIHYLAPASVGHLRKRRLEQQTEREAMGADRQTHTSDGDVVSMVFTAVHDGLATTAARPPGCSTRHDEGAVRVLLRLRDGRRRQHPDSGFVGSFAT